MEITLARLNEKTGGLNYSYSDVEKLLNAVKFNKYATYGMLFRGDFPRLKEASESRYFSQIYQVMVSARFVRSAEHERVFRSHSGVLALQVKGLHEPQMIASLKEKSMLLPQTLAAMTGCDGQSLVILVRVSLPGGGRPKKEADAELFHIKAYRMAVICYESVLGKPISIENPRLDSTFLMPFDTDLMVNEHAVPFIVEQPTKAEVEKLMDGRMPANEMGAPHGNPHEFYSMSQVFDGCYKRVRHEMSKEDWLTPMASLTRLAHECAESGLPEEEATFHLLWHYYKLDKMVVRSTVRAVYEGYDPLPPLNVGMPKKQVASIMLKHFMERRYELRRNVVTQALEYRVRNSIDFRFHELTKYDKNTIKYEAAIEGIEAFDAEISGFIESNYTPQYNPIDDYIDNLGAWDGTDRIDDLAGMVPTADPNWKRLFRRWFLSMVAHWMDIDHEHGNSTAPILIGKQGFRKSTFCRILLPPELRSFFTDSVDFRTKQEAERYLTRFLLINIDEFDQLSEQQFAFVKHLFQKPNVSMRRMYSESIAQMRRYASFIGTSNHQEILRDPTGNRRYLCVEVTDPIRTETPINYRQLYAQAVELIRKGERYWLNDEDEALLRDSNQSFDVQSPLELVLLDTLRPAEENAAEGEWLKVTDIMALLIQHHAFNRKTMNNLKSLGKVLHKLDFASKRRKDGMYYNVVRVER